jgi:guanylate kinase
MKKTESLLIVVSGPSGAGKTTLVERVLPMDANLRASVSVTTRPPRKGEVDGRDYHFVSEAEFERMKAKDLVEWAEVHGYLYGTPRKFLEEQLAGGRDVVLNIDVQGGIEVKKLFPGAVMIFILPPTFDSLRRRMLGRGGDDPKDIEIRLENARKEIEAADRYDYLVVNDEIDEAAREIMAVITAERLRRARRLESFLERFFED